MSLMKLTASNAARPAQRVSILESHGISCTGILSERVCIRPVMPCERPADSTVSLSQAQIFVNAARRPSCA